jgi:hypothetical protein
VICRDWNAAKVGKIRYLLRILNLREGATEGALLLANLTFIECLS